MTAYKEYINPEVEFKVRQRGKKDKKQSIKGGPVEKDSKKNPLLAKRGGGRAFYKGGKV